MENQSWIQTKRDRVNRFNLILLLAFFLIATLGIVNHEMWRDELQAWLIAKDSLSIPELLENLKYEGHPALWYLCLRLLSKLTDNPLIIQLFQLIIATIVVFIFIYYSTFNRLQKTLFCFGYFPLYEYGIISRSYSLGVLLTFSFCALLSRQNYNCVYLAFILALLSHTSVYGIMLGFSLVIMLILAIAQDNHLSISNFFSQPSTVKKIVISISIYFIGLLTAIAQIIPPVETEHIDTIAPNIKLYELYEDNSLTIIDKTLKSIRESEVAITGIWRSYAPIPSFSANRQTWGSNILTNNSQLPDIATINIGNLAAACISILLFSIFIIVFFNQYKVLLAYIFGNLSIMFFSWTFKYPNIRHSGHLFILLIACCWIYFYQVRSNKPILSSSNIANLCRKHYTALLTIILCIQLYAGIKMYSIDLIKPFSNSKSVAQFIKNNRLEELTIVGSKDIIVAPISAWLNRKIYYPGIQDFGTYTAVTKNLIERNRDISQENIIREIEKLVDRDNKSLLLILSSDELQKTSTFLNIALLKSFDEDSISEEQYFVYYINL